MSKPSQCRSKREEYRTPYVRGTGPSLSGPRIKATEKAKRPRPHPSWGFVRELRAAERRLGLNN